MSWYFNKTDEQYVTMAANTALNLPDDDWAIAGWIKLLDNAGDRFRFLMSCGTWDTNPSYNVYLLEEGRGLRPNEITNKISTHALLEGTTGIGTSTEWQHIIIQRSSYYSQLYIDGVKDVQSALSTGFDFGELLWFWGIDNNLTADYRFKGYLAEWAKWDRALSEEERTNLAGGLRPSEIATDLAWYVPMYDDFTESTGTLSLTNHDATAHSDVHPEMTGGAPNKSINPTPTHESFSPEFLDDYTLSWDDGGGADTFDVYVGDALDNLILVSSAQVGTSCIVSFEDRLSPLEKTWYWRVDATNENGTTEGDVWEFDVYTGMAMSDPIVVSVYLLGLRYNIMNMSSDIDRGMND